jgi:serine/threonine-protein kinase RsbW
MQMDTGTEKNISIASKTECLADVEKLIDVICDEQRLNQDYYGNILIAITEAVNNAIVHGNKLNPDKTIRVTCKAAPAMISFVVEDEGEGFDFNNLPDPTDPENLEKPSGRGVFLMKHLADDVRFSEDGRRVELDFAISAN